MAVSRVTEAQTFTLLTERASRLQTTIQDLQDQVASGRRLLHPDQDPLGATEVVRHGASLAALGQYGNSASFGSNVLGAEDQILEDAKNLMVRAEQIATEQASDLNAPGRATALEEVHGLLRGMTVLANTEFAGRRLFSGLALDSPAPFADPDSAGYSAATAYSGAAQEFSLKIGGAATDRVRISTRGDTVFQSALVGLEALQTALATNGDAATTLTGLAQGRDALITERASVGAREAQLIDRNTQVSGLTIREQGALARVRDADLVTVVTHLTQAQTALQAVLASGARIAQTSLLDYLKL
jgi:flagellar hook-associated protein 3 FlgL